jgi:hypothetical protein
VILHPQEWRFFTCGSSVAAGSGVSATACGSLVAAGSGVSVVTSGILVIA